jgi:hypothetical protein
MGEISTIHGRPATATDFRSTQADRHAPGASQTAPKDAAPQAPEDASQLTKLSSVLNGLKRGASAMRAQVTHAMAAVRSGDYHVDPLQVSRSIVMDSMVHR